MDNEEDLVRQSFSDFANDFGVSSMRNTLGRAMRRNEDPTNGVTLANDFLHSKFTGLQPKGSVLVQGAGALPDAKEKKVAEEAMHLANFGIKKGSSHASLERGLMWCGRLGLACTRQVAMASTSQMRKFMRDKGIVGVDVKTFFMDIREGTLKAAIDSGVQIWFATLGKYDFLFIPSNMVVRDHVMNDADCFGLRFAMIVPLDKAGMADFKGVAEHASTLAGHTAKVVMSLAKLAEKKVDA